MTSLAKNCPQCGMRYEARAGYCQRDGSALVLTESQSDPWVGKTLMEQFRIEERIGRGGMGSVYRAHQTVLGRDVAVKILHSELSQSAEAKQRFMREARILTAIDHPNVVRIFLFGELPDGSLYIVMELLRGRPLSEILKAEITLASERAVHIAHQVALGVGDAHTQGVVHRDLKPENILIIPKKRDPDHAKVLDFGIARVFDGDPGDNLHTRTGLIFGTARYISPEGARGDRTDARSDVYSIGIVLYEMLCGHIPFAGETQMDILQAHVSTVPRPLLDWPSARGVPNELALLVMRCLQKAPERRPADANELADLLVPFLGPRSRKDAMSETSGVQPIGKRSEVERDSLPPSLSFTKPFYARSLFWFACLAMVSLGALAWCVKVQPGAVSTEENATAALTAAIANDALGPEPGEIERLTALRLAHDPHDRDAPNARKQVARALIEKARAIMYTQSSLSLALLDRADALSDESTVETRTAIAQANREEISVFPTAISMTPLTLRARVPSAVGLSEPHFEIFRGAQRVTASVPTVADGPLFEAAYVFQTSGVYRIRFVAGREPSQMEVAREVEVARSPHEPARARPEQNVTTTIMSANTTNQTAATNAGRLAANAAANGGVVAVPIAQPEIQPLQPSRRRVDRATDPRPNPTTDETGDDALEAPPPWQSGPQ